jgi:hypothetical protein
LREGPTRGGGGGPVAHRGVGTDGGVADEHVEEDGGRDQGYPGHANVETDIPLLKEADHTVGGGQPEGAAAGQEQGVRGAHGAHGPQSVRLSRPGGRTPHVHAHHGSVWAFEEDDGAAGDTL